MIAVSQCEKVDSLWDIEVTCSRSLRGSQERNPALKMLDPGLRGLAGECSSSCLHTDLRKSTAR
jgi:hypothetical protein